ncbi:MAG TPA: ABC transporter permease, partial [Lamprocystis sp. (in: g-proteobacteria)]|nr:ABC transporter permease [Lamprocystis sp. (in: g-proteobacteria)]
MLPTVGAPPSWLISQFRAGVDQTQFRRALADLWRGLSAWPLWGYLGYHEIRQRYRRSVLGPFWITISMGVMVLALGLLYGTIFKQPLQHYLPYVTTGFIVWGLLSSFITDGLKSFIKAGGLIRQMSVPLSVHVYRLVWGNLIIFGHNLLVYVAVASWFQVDLGWSLLLAPLAIGLLVLNGVWIGLLFGLLSARFRDIPLIVGSVLQVVFFLTPVIWRADML